MAMRVPVLSALAVSLVLLACRPAPAHSADAADGHAAMAATPDSAVALLLDYSAKDFHDHGPAGPLRVRNVRLGHFTSADHAGQQLICGEMLAAGGDSTGQWTHFATIHTDPYEQWLGGQALGFCSDAGVAWDSAGDLAAELQRRLDAR